ncbi:MAG: NADPH:quinone reductase, partial [Candidatus Eremiobacterota bacterium]
APGPGEVLVRIRAAGVNPVETYIRSGSYGRLPELPYTPGTDGAGEVEAVGPGVATAVGARVYLGGSLTGTYAEKALGREDQVHPLPDRVDFAMGAAVSIPYFTAYRALFQRAGARPGETVLIHGASGGVGQAAVQLARSSGLLVLGTAGSERGRREVLEHGAHACFDHTEPGYGEAIRPYAPAIILEMLANVNLERDLSLLAPRGRVVVIGNRGRLDFDPRLAMVGEHSILGTLLSNATEPEMREARARIEAGLRDGTLAPVVGHRFPLSQAARAHEAVMGARRCGKVVLDC